MMYGNEDGMIYEDIDYVSDDSRSSSNSDNDQCVCNIFNYKLHIQFLKCVYFISLTF